MKAGSEKFLIIGDGPSGLGVAKALKETGISHDQAEAYAEVGGNWYPGVYETADELFFRNATQFADFSMPLN